ncbi:ANTAR domain-containing protein [uncultured Friedmanniella sp.]|uniref:ANTAR domain-containing protein n=1 Tax=uncultured Friedmanniella sp. TaxID=335381 RepID=UPI0035CC8993
MTRAGRDAEPSDAGPAAHAVVPLLEDYLASVARQTAEQLGEVGGVAVTFGLGADPVTIGASSQLALEVDLIQYEIGIGPCLHALHTNEALYVPDLAADDRWGEYGPRAAARGAASCCSVPVRVDGQPQAVLKVYAREVDGLDAEQQRIAAEVALTISGGVALAMHLTRHARELDDRAAAMDRRRTIDLALGMLMERNHTGADAAFDLLRRYSQHYNVRLHEAAATVVKTHDESASTSTAPFLPGRGTS